jgi:hypothetical protein
VKRATRIEATSESTADCGRVSVPFEAGSVYLGHLERKDGDVHLVWKKGDKALPVPAGRYTVRHWSIEKEHQGELWILSVSSPTGRAILVTDGEDLALDLDTKVHVSGHFVHHGKAARVELSITGGDGNGASVVRKDRLIEVGYRIEDKDGGEVAHGVMTYG